MNLKVLLMGGAIGVATMCSQASAQLSGQTFNLDPESCAVGIPLQCTIDVGPPQPPLYEFSWGTFYPQYIVWENRPFGQLGTSEIDSETCTAYSTTTIGNQTTTQCAVLLVAFHGNYLNSETGYTGSLAMNLTYHLLPSRYRVIWSEYIVSGTMTIN